MYSWILRAWVLLGLFWLAASLIRKRAVRRQSAKSRAVQGSLVFAGLVLLLDSRLGLGPLGWRFIPESAGAGILGFALAICGMAFAVWARISLGRNWSGIAAVKQGHELVRHGPYAIVRHPIYSGFLLALAGTAIALGEVRGLIGFALVWAALWMKLQTEEAFMLQQFGEQYREYKKKVKALVPFVF